MQVFRCVRWSQLSQEGTHVGRGERCRFSRKLSQGLGRRASEGCSPRIISSPSSTSQWSNLEPTGWQRPLGGPARTRLLLPPSTPLCPSHAAQEPGPCYWFRSEEHRNGDVVGAGKGGGEGGRAWGIDPNWTTWWASKKTFPLLQSVFSTKVVSC